jgi:hypothetical protein
MHTTAIHFYQLRYSDYRTYLAAFLFVIGNIILPQLCHLLPHGGLIWLPIYFFTLVGAYKYGWQVGLLTGILSPLINSLLFGMPMPEALPAILLKSVLLALIAGWTAKRYQRVSLLLLAAIVLAYQVIGTAGEWLFASDLHAALQDFRIGIPGMLLQIVGGYAILKYVIRNSITDR